MPSSGIRHIDVGSELTRTEWESQETHELIHGNAFPGSPVERQLFYRDDEHRWYIYNGSTWVWLGGMEEHGNEYHSPAFATATAVAAHQAETSAHSATPNATPQRIIVRDASGRAQVAAPANENDIARKAEVDAKPSTFLQLADTPSSYSGQALKSVRVTSDAAALEFTNPPDLFPLTRFLRATRYHIWPAGTNTTIALTANTLNAVAFITPVARTITRMAIQVTTLSAGNARLGIYIDDGSVYPESLLLDAGTVDTGSTGIKEITGLNTSLLANTLYWFVLVTNATPTISAVTAGTAWQPLGYTSTALNVVGAGYWQVSFSYAALPNPFPSGATTTANHLPKIAVFL